MIDTTSQHTKIYMNDFINIQHIITLFYIEMGKRPDYREKHNFWELVYVDSGEMIIDIDGTLTQLNQGDIYLIKPNQSHQFTNYQIHDTKLLISSFTCNSDFMNNKMPVHYSCDHECTNILSHIMKELISSESCITTTHYTYFFDSNIASKSDPTFYLSLKLNLELLFLHIWRKSVKKALTSISGMESESEKDELCKNVIGIIKERLYSTLKIEDLCRELNCSKTVLCSHFRKITGKTIMQEYNNLKIREAKKLIKSNQYSISEISNILNYSSPYYFSIAFKKNTGISPNEYKKNIISVI
ncbi:MAG: AraC family transcriptional regulator [Clostridia bacterium]|nr:AraC family transcriptional regulator [Clostridia bacterium]